MTPTSLRMLSLAATLGLLAALLPLPYGYYQFLRLAICIVAIAIGVSRWHQRPLSGALLLLVAVIFNPVVPVTFPRDTWAIIDLASAMLFGWVALNTRQSQSS